MCKTMLLFDQTSIIVLQILVHIIMIVRVYAYYNRDRRVLVSMAAVAVIAIAVGLWAVVFSSPPSSSVVFQDPITGRVLACNNSLTSKQGLHLAIAWSGLLVLDVIIFVLTLWRSWITRAGIGSDRPTGAHESVEVNVSIGEGRHYSLADVILRDGAMYFGVMAVASAANITILLVESAYKKGMGACFTNVISTTMVTRLMLNLRERFKEPFGNTYRSDAIDTWSVCIRTDSSDPIEEG
ncbi:hypothetical protein V8B97DRAFT_826953 [Scleroderma yunnanense]